MKRHARVAWMLGALLALLGLSTPEPVYWVVPGAPGTASELTLPEVAQRVLGDSSRWPEILELNEGRAQFDGEALTRDGELTAGWALVLPAGARSGEIRLGPPPGPAVADDSASSVLAWAYGGLVLLLLASIGSFVGRLRRPRAAPAAVRPTGSREVLDRALRQVTALPSPPSVYAAVIGPDRVSLRLAPAQPDAPPPWQARKQGSVWEAPNWQLDTVPEGPAELPLLATIGTIGGEPTVVNLGRAPGLIAFTGDRTAAMSAVVAVVAEVAADPRARDVPIVVVGPGLPARPAPDRIQHAPDAAAALAAPAGPRLVVVTGPVASAVAMELGRFAAGAGSRTAVLAVGDIPHAAWRFEARADGSLDAQVLGLSLDTAVSLSKEGAS